MLQIFKAIPLVKNLPLNIECLTANDDCLIIATKQGHLMRYRFGPKRTNLNPAPSTQSASLTSLTNQELEVQLVKTLKNLSKKSVTRIETIPEEKIIVSLSDGLIHVDSLDDLSSIQIIQKTKGATCFATNLEPQVTLSGGFQYLLRLCVVIKRKVTLYYWKNKNFHELSKITLKDTPKTIAWCKESLCVAYKSEYQLIKLNLISLQEDKNEEFTLSVTCGKQAEPSIKVLRKNKFSINKDESTYLIDTDGELCLKQPVCWSDIPVCLADDYPYLVALLPSSTIEVRTLKPHLFIQRLELAQSTSNYSKVRILTSCAKRKGLLIAASSNDIFAIVSIPIEQQKAQMISEKHYELALNLAKSIEDDVTVGGSSQSREQFEEDDEDIYNIELQYAHDLFQREQYKEALELFLKLELSPLIVIDLYPELADKVFTQYQPDLSSSTARQHLQSSSSTNNSNKPHPQHQKQQTTSEQDNVKITSLIDYLIQIRRKISGAKCALNNSNNSKNVSTVSSNEINSLSQEPNLTFKSHLTSSRALERLKQEVDTTLFKCYLKTSSKLVGPLLRLPDNSCKLQVTEKALLRYHKFNELIILYKSRGLHRKSLELLKSSFANDLEGALDKTVSYLQNLGVEHMEIICEYAKYVLDERPELGLKIFTADQLETEQLDRNLVLEFLHHNAPQLVIPYLEHIIFLWNEKSTLFHNALLLRYRQKVAPLLAKYVDSLKDGESPCAAGKEAGELGEMRRKLLSFLEISDYYTVDGLSTILLNEGLCEERAIVVGKLGQHEEALSIFIYVLDNPKRAEEYCEAIYKKKASHSKDIFLLLLKLYLHPPDSLTRAAANMSLENERRIRTQSISSVATNASHLTTVTTTTFQDVAAHSSCNATRRTSVSSRIMPWIDSSNVDFTSKVVKLLENHGDKIDPIAAINELPNNIKLRLLRSYLKSTLKQNVQAVQEKEIIRKLMMPKFYNLQKIWINLQQTNKVIIEDSTICQVCMKRIGRSAFVRFPNYDLVHYSCRDSYGKMYNNNNSGASGGGNLFTGASPIPASVARAVVGGASSSKASSFVGSPPTFSPAHWQ